MSSAVKDRASKAEDEQRQETAQALCMAVQQQPMRFVQGLIIAK